jgi:hypothetical protein
MTNPIKVDWVHFKDMEGPRVLGSAKFNPPAPWGEWTKIMGVIARSEGSYNSVAMFDGTGCTWGFLRHTFTSGRLQRLLESFKTILVESDEICTTLWDDLKLQDKFSKFNFSISSGKFYDIAKKQILNPAFPSQKKRIVDICMSSKDSALQLAILFGTIGQDPRVQRAQEQFGKNELIHALDPVRPPLGEYKTIRNLLNDDWTTLSPALFWNLWQNNPGAAYKLFINARKESDANGTSLFDVAWRLVNRSSFGNWGWGSGNKSPRVTRIKDAIKEFYGIDLMYVKP